jgi:hypothetical protein
VKTGDFELLGDLQIKQGRVQEAIHAYHKAVEAQPDSKRKAAIYQKLAQAHLKADDKYADTVAKAIEYLHMAQQSAKDTRGSGAPTPTSPPKLLTSKLILTAPKSLLDGAAKTLSFDEFRQAVRVERITAPIPEARGDTKQKSGTQ